MRISLLHNPDAGPGVSLQTVSDMISHAGHELVRVIDKREDLAAALATPSDLVVAAGGDGTVGRAARALAGRGIPLAVLPLGTANNIARSLGIEGVPSAIVASWKDARSVRIDLGMCHGDWGERSFIESVGGGLVPHAIAHADKVALGDQDSHADARLFRAHRVYRDVLPSLEPRRIVMTLDDERVEGEFLLVEVLNMRSIGANLELAPEVDATDGFLDVVAATADDRAAIDADLARKIDGHPTDLRLPRWRVKKVEIHGWRTMHVDDKVHDELSASPVRAWLEPGALELLLGPERD